MAQIIKHRRGSLEALSAVTSSLSKGEIIIASGSTNLESVSNGKSLVFAVPENGQVQAVNRFLIAGSDPSTFASSTYNGMLDGVPYYNSGSGTLFLLSGSSNYAISLIGNIQPFSTSVNSRLATVETSIGGGGSIGSRVSALEVFSGSQETKNSTLATYTASVNSRLDLLSTDSGSQAGRLSNLEIFSGSQQTKDLTLAVFSSSVNTFTASQESKDASLALYTASMNSFTASQESKDVTLALYTASMNTFTASQESKDATLATLTGSIATEQTNQNNRLNRIEESTASLNSYTASLNTAITLSGSNVTIAGNLTVGGTQTIVNSTTVQIGDNIIELNGTGAANGGLLVKDPTAPNTVSGSLLWDSNLDYWKAGQLGSEYKILLANGDGVVSGSSQITLQSTTGFSAFSSSIATSFSASDARELELSTSVDSRLDTIETSLGGGGSIGARVSALETFSGSQQAKDVTLASYTSSMNTFTASQESKDATLATYTASVNAQLASLQNVTGSYATTGSNTFFGTQTISASFNVSGSSNFNGAVAVNDSNMNLTNSSSLNLTSGSSIYVAGAGVISGSIVGIGNVTAFSSSIDTKFGAVHASTASLNTFSASQNTKNETLRLYTASIDTKFTTLATYTGSNDTTNTTQNTRLSRLEESTASLNTFTHSANSRLTTLEGAGTIQGVGTTNNVTFGSLTTTNNVTVGGDLVVQGNTVTLNTSTLIVEDKTIQIASGSANAAAANGAGIEVVGASATFTYDATPNAWTANIPISASAVTASVNVPGFGASKRITFRATSGNLDFITAPTTAGDLVQWDGTNFTMSNVIDGGSF